MSCSYILSSQKCFIKHWQNDVKSCCWHVTYCCVELKLFCEATPRIEFRCHCNELVTHTSRQKSKSLPTCTCLFISRFCLFLLLLIVLFENFIFHYMETSTSPVPVKGLQVRPVIGPHGHWLSEYSEGSVACHTYCVTGCWFCLSLEGSVTCCIELSLPV